MRCTGTPESRLASHSTAVDGAVAVATFGNRGQRRLELEHEPHAARDGSHDVAAQPTGAIGQRVAVDRDDLRHVRDGVFRKTRRASPE